MPIPQFDHNLVLPPHLGNPASPVDLSPYHCSTLELCQCFSTSKERRDILANYLNFRNRLRTNGMAQNAIKCLDGSLLEDIEQQQKRAPRDLDLLTIYWGYDLQFQQNLVAAVPEFNDPSLAKQNLKLDHYPFDASYSPLKTVELSRYWAQLFSHNRNGVWKGMLSIPLNTPTDDLAALDYLRN